MNISGSATLAMPEMLFYTPGDLTVTFVLKKGAIFFENHRQKLRRRIGGFRESPVRRPFSFQREQEVQKGGVAWQKRRCAKHVSKKEEKEK